jgi:hypothetical protein
VYAVVDKDGDQRGDEIHTIAQGLNHPNGTAFKDGSLYVAEINRILRFDKIEENLADPPSQSSSTIAYPMTFITAGSSSPSAPTACSTSLSGRPATSASQIPISTPS